MKLYQIRLVQALKYSSVLPVRLILAMTSLITALSLIVGPEAITSSTYYTKMFSAMPRWLWAALFAGNGIALWWRIISDRPRTGMSRVINSWTFGLYFANVWTSSASIGYFSPGNSAELMLCLMALWTAIRTDFTKSDRDTA